MESSKSTGNKAMNPEIKIFTSANCSFCTWAKKLLDRKQAIYEEIRVDLDDEQRKVMTELAKQASVPQIFIGDQHIGGYQDLVTLDQEGALDELLNSRGN